MKLFLLGAFCLCVCFGFLHGRAVEKSINVVYRLAPTISVREALLCDLEGIYAADKEISFEHFLPVYNEISKVNQLPATAKKLLEDELEADLQLFRDAVNHRGIYRLFIAYDNQTNECCGFALFSTKDQKEVKLDLLLIRKKFRGKGAGKELIKHALASHYKLAQKCMVYPFKNGNSGALKFYEKLGFKRLGDGPAGYPCILGKFQDLYYAYELSL